MADTALRRRPDRPPGPGLAVAGRRLAAVVRGVAGVRPAGLRLHRDGRGRRRGQPAQPAVRDLLRAAVGRASCPLSLLVGPAYKAISPARTINAAFAKLTGRRPRARRLHLPRAAGPLAGRRRALRLRVDGAGLPVRDRARAGAAVVRGVRRGDAAGRRAVRQHLLRARRPLRGLLDPGLPDVGVGTPRRASWCIRSPLANLDTTPVRPGPGRGDVGAVRQHGVRLLQGLDALGEVHPGRLRPGPRADPPAATTRGCSRSSSPSPWSSPSARC